MPQRVTQSHLTRTQRIERAFAMFAKGYRNIDVARTLAVSRDTARRYRDKYESHIQSEVSENPRILTDVLGNTIRVVEEIDLVRKDAWDRLDADKRKRRHRCSECGCEYHLQVNEATALHKVIMDAADKRMRLFGLLGVKQEYFLHVQRIQLLQTKIIEFLQTELCDTDRQKFERFLTRELGAVSLDEPIDTDSRELPTAV